MVDTPTIFRAAQRAALLEELDELLAEGHERGYLTSDRLESALQEVELSPEQLEELFAAQEVGLASASSATTWTPSAVEVLKERSSAGLSSRPLPGSSTA